MINSILKFRHKYWPDHFLGEILAKRWMETAVPVIILLFTVLWLSNAIPGFLSATSISDIFRQAGEVGLVVLGLSLVMIVGGISSGKCVTSSFSGALRTWAGSFTTKVCGWMCSSMWVAVM